MHRPNPGTPLPAGARLRLPCRRVFRSWSLRPGEVTLRRRGCAPFRRAFGRRGRGSFPRWRRRRRLHRHAAPRPACRQEGWHRTIHRRRAPLRGMLQSAVPLQAALPQVAASLRPLRGRRLPGCLGEMYCRSFSWMEWPPWQSFPYHHSNPASSRAVRRPR